MSSAGNALQLVPFKSSKRGHSDHGWLKTYHSFPFAGHYQDFPADSWGALRVINEDRVAPTQGFGTHSHREFEIFSYLVSGELFHRDSVKNSETLKRGEVQMTSTGTGISHSEYNENKDKPVHFIQIWAKPHTARLNPGYYTREFSDEEKRGKLLKTVAPVEDPDVTDVRNGKGPVPIHSHLTMYSSILLPQSNIDHPLSPKTSKAYLHLIMTSGYRSDTQPAPSGAAKLRVSGGGQSYELEEGDGMFVQTNGEGGKELTFESVGGKDAEFLFFEMQ